MITSRGTTDASKVDAVEVASEDHDVSAHSSREPERSEEEGDGVRDKEKGHRGKQQKVVKKK